MRRILSMLLCLICLTGSAAAVMPEVRGYDHSAESDYQYLTIGTYPYEEDGTEAPLVWRVIGRDGDVIILFTEDIIDVHQGKEISDYQKSKARKYTAYESFSESDLFAWVNGEMADTILKNTDFSAAIVEYSGGKFHIMANETELRRTDWGFPDSTMGTVKENDWETVAPLAKNRMGYGTPYAKTHVLYANWGNKSKNKLYQDHRYGGAVAYWTSKLSGKKMGIVGANGHLSWSGYGDVQKGVRPSMLLALDRLQITGGSGTKQDPWIMEVADSVGETRLRVTGGIGSASDPWIVEEYDPGESTGADAEEAGD